PCGTHGGPRAEIGGVEQPAARGHCEGEQEECAPHRAAARTPDRISSRLRLLFSTPPLALTLRIPRPPRCGANRLEARWSSKNTTRTTCPITMRSAPGAASLMVTAYCADGAVTWSSVESGRR